MPNCPVCDKHAGKNAGDDPGMGDGCWLLMSAYILAGLAMMLNIRLSYSSAPYALIRFKLPENLFSVFVRRMASSLELWCLPGFILTDAIDLCLKGYWHYYDYNQHYNLKSDGGPDYGNPKHAGNLHISSGSDLKPAREHKFHWIIIPSIIAQWLNFATYVILLIVYRGGGEEGYLTRFYWIIAISGFVFGISNPMVYAVDFNYIPIYIAGENCFPALTSFIHYLATLAFGNRRKWNSDYLLVYIDIWVAIIISFVAAAVWTVGYGIFKDTTKAGGGTAPYGHIFTFGFGSTNAQPSLAAPLLIVLVGMGLVYAIYPGIAPGMIVPFYLIDKIEMVLLIATIFPPLIVAVLRKTSTAFGDPRSPACGWDGDNFGQGTGAFWQVFDLVVPLMIILAYIFIYSIHYRDSNLSRSIVNQPKMSTALTIIFYMCHEISLAVGFAGMIGNGAEYTVIAQLVGAFLMVFLALYSEGYIIKYKSHDHAHWPTTGMTVWNALCYWCERSSKITNKFFKQLRFAVFFNKLFNRC
ncbi:Tpr-related protein family member, putative [Theileria annulata]|uniref:Tpr-related protein family member, putative n=1 Tax=Theileria annulata TaxID=5874 RepID=Q4UC19_THEAN|nr:Tpr-related protein family member, putative [Theileria annulata]CAI75632.1 Tpr-related protein family member, putative [Theileria annulata]|eukprot:XP_955108.1 Tpr-related protein family member, putative [Theileria annulata]